MHLFNLTEGHEVCATQEKTVQAFDVQPEVEDEPKEEQEAS